MAQIMIKFDQLSSSTFEDFWAQIRLVAMECGFNHKALTSSSFFLFEATEEQFLRLQTYIYELGFEDVEVLYGDLI